MLTGHAFQCFLTQRDRQAVLKTIKTHLASDGQFIFDSRNPRQRAWMEWTPDLSQRSFDHPDHGMVVARNDVAVDPLTSVVTYQTFYEALESGRRWSAESHIAFIAQDRLSETLNEAGLKVDRWMGDWQGNIFDQNSPEIIPIGGLA